MDQNPEDKLFPKLSATITKPTELNFVSFGVSSYAFAMPIASSEVEVLIFFHFYTKI